MKGGCLMIRARTLRPLLCVVLGLVGVSSADAEEPRRDAHGDVLPAGALARLGTARFRPTRELMDACLSEDGGLVVIREKDAAQVGVLDGVTGEELRRLDIPKS